MKIAIIGSGIGGLSCAWLLCQQKGHAHEVTLYEAHDRLGMGAHTVDIPVFSEQKTQAGGNTLPRSESVAVDMPMRVFYPEYYPILSSIYSDAGVATETLDYCGSFSRLSGKPVFRYKNYSLGHLSLPFIHIVDLFRPDSALSTARLGAKLVAFLRRLPGYSRDNQLNFANETLGEFIARVKLSKELCEHFLLPAYAGVCTCSYDNLLNYPARIILDYLNSGLMLSSMRRAANGVDDVVHRLSQHVSRLKLSTPVESVNYLPDGVEVLARDGQREVFDHVIVATQADQAISILKGTEFTSEHEVLTAFDYEGFEVIVHNDRRLAPLRPGWQAPVNFILSDGARAPMATIPLNSVHKALSSEVPIYQTWNPLIEPRAESVFKAVKLFRPLINENSVLAQNKIQTMHSEPGRSVWLCGSYTSPGIPLQESAAFSAQQIAEKISQASIEPLKQRAKISA